MYEVNYLYISVSRLNMRYKRITSGVATETQKHRCVHMILTKQKKNHELDLI